MSDFVLKDDSNLQNSNENNEFSQIGGGLVNNQSNFVMNSSKRSSQKLSHLNMVNTSNDHFGNEDQKNQFCMQQNSDVHLVNNQSALVNKQSFSKNHLEDSQQKDSYINQFESKHSLKNSKNRNEMNFQNLDSKYSQQVDSFKGTQEANSQFSDNKNIMMNSKESGMNQQEKYGLQSKRSVNNSINDGNFVLNNYSERTESNKGSLIDDSVNKQSEKSFQNKQQQDDKFHENSIQKSLSHQLVNESDSKIKLNSQNSQNSAHINLENTNSNISSKKSLNNVVESQSELFVKKDENQNSFLGQEDNVSLKSKKSIKNSHSRISVQNSISNLQKKQQPSQPNEPSLKNIDSNIDISKNSDPISQIQSVEKEKSYNQIVLESSVHNYQPDPSPFKESKVSIRNKQSVLKESISQQSKSQKLQDQSIKNDSINEISNENAFKVQSDIQQSNRSSNQVYRLDESENKYNQNEEEKQPIHNLEEFNNNFSIKQNQINVIDSLKYSSDPNPFSRNFPKSQNDQINQRQDVPTPMNSLEQQLLSHEKRNDINQGTNDRYQNNQSTLILPELKEASSHFTIKQKPTPQKDNHPHSQKIFHKKIEQKPNHQLKLKISAHGKYQKHHPQTNKNIQLEKQTENQTNFDNLPTFNKHSLQENFKKININVHNQDQSSHNDENQHHQINEEINRSRKISQLQDPIIFHSQNFEGENQHIQRKRIETQFTQDKFNQNLPSLKIRHVNNPNQNNRQIENNSSIFQTQILPSNLSLANSKLSKIKQAKQYKKKRLQEQLAKISLQIDHLNKKEAQIKQFGPSQKNFSDRLRINNNTEARQKALSLVKNLQKERKARQMEKNSSIDRIDHRITDHLSQLTKIRSQNEKKLKQKKKLQIIDRMKDKQIKKINEIKKIEASSKFVSQFLRSPQLKPNRDHLISPNSEVHEELSTEQRRKSKLQNKDDGMTPELAHKKAYLSRVRNLSQKKHKLDLHGHDKLDPYQNKLN